MPLRALLLVCALLVPALARAADGDLVAGTGKILGLWRIVEVKLCDAKDPVSDCAEVNLATKFAGLGWPEHAVYEVVADDCSTKANYEIAGYSSSGGQEHLLEECAANNKLSLSGLANTKTSCFIGGPPRQFWTRAAMLNAGVTCGTPSFELRARYFFRLR